MLDEQTRALLYDLLLALFQSEPELRRFLVLEQLLRPDQLPLTRQREPSLSETAYQAIEALEEPEAVEALLAALERRSPDRVDDIREVAERAGIGQDRAAPPPEAPRLDPEPPSSPGGGENVSPEVAAFALELTAELDALEEPEASPRALDPDHWPWTAVAAVLGSFRPSRLRSLPGTIPGSPALVALADFAFTSFDGSWVLQREFRIPCLQRLEDEHLFAAALDANQDLPDLHRDLVRRLLDGWAPVVTSLDTRELEAVGVVADWLEPVVGAELGVHRAAISAAAERRLLIDPLRALVGTHFRGRTEEVARLHSHVLGTAPEHILVIQGPGGAGKSTLVGKVLTDLEDEANLGQPVSFAYIDFDRAGNDPHDPLGLVEQMARQLRLLYATAAEASQFAAVEAIGAGTDLERAAEVLQLDRGDDLSDMVSALADRLREVRGQAGWERTPLVLVLDTFEEVQVRGPGATHDVLDLVRRLQAALPEMRVIVSGRAVVTEFQADGTVSEVHLGDLDPEAADAVLAHLGVESPDLRRRVVQQFGSNPLTLRLAAEALTGAGAAELTFDAVVSETEALARVSVELVQGVLYSRILGHIGDADVVKVAYPGLAVRLVTVEVLREVLAEPCRFDPDRAEDIFDKLRTEVSMFELEDPDTLRHRQDVRRLMLRTMLDDPARRDVVAEIHRRAAAYYAARPGPRARAEQLYHRLMGGEDPRTLDRLWSPSLNPLLASAMEEPLPDRARSWLGRRLGLVDADQERAQWDQEDWEADTASRATSWLASNDPLRCLEVLAERSERLEGSRLYAIEVAACTAIGDLQRGAEVLELGLRSALSAGDRTAQLELLERATKLRALQGDGPGVVDAARSAVALTDVTGQRARGVQALTDAAAALMDLGLDREAATLNAEISRRFASFDRSDMRSRPELVRQVLHTAGTTETAVLLHAAAEVGDLAHDRDSVFVEDSFALRRLLQQTSSEAGPALAALADEVGLDQKGWKVGDLASRAVRLGRTGKAIAVALDYADDAGAARRLVVDSLVRPIDRPTS